MDDGKVTRRAVVGGLAAGAVAACASKATPGPQASDKGAAMSGERLPVVFLPHGGGPWPFVDVGFPQHECDAMAAYLRGVKAVTVKPPKALLVVSAHWEETVPTVMTSPKPPMLYDYYGFPPASYTIQWPAPGAPEVAARVRQLLGAAGFETREDATRGFDHGTFVPLKLTYPEADVPTLQLSLKAGLNPAEHIAMGRAIAPLRDEGVFIVGSGMTFHNLRLFWDARAHPHAEAFDAWLREAVLSSERDAKLSAWERAPSARLVHPREEHLLPLMVVAGAAGSDAARVTFDGTTMGQRISGFQFG